MGAPERVGIRQHGCRLGVKIQPEAGAAKGDPCVSRLRRERQLQSAEVRHDRPEQPACLVEPSERHLRQTALGLDVEAVQARCRTLAKQRQRARLRLQGCRVMAIEPLRDPERYFITIFGEPAATGVWGWSFEGHHFSQNLVVSDGKVVGDTPSFWGANPATVSIFIEGGPEVGTRTLAKEEQLAFDLLASLEPSQAAAAVIADKAPADYRGPGQPEPPRSAPEGIPAKRLTELQKETLRSLIAAYAGNLAPDLAAARLAEIDASGFDRVHFAWLGANKPGVGHAYRIQGPTFLLELVNIQSDPAGNPANHIHSVWRSLNHDFGVAN